MPLSERVDRKPPCPECGRHDGHEMNCSHAIRPAHGGDDVQPFEKMVPADARIVRNDRTVIARAMLGIGRKK